MAAPPKDDIALATVREDDLKAAQVVEVAGGVARADAMELVWGKHGKKLLWAGIVCMLLAYQFDNALLYNYRNYAASDFNNVAGLATLATAGNIVFAVFKPPIAKVSDVVGRGEAYVFCICCYLLGYILCASSTSFGAYAGGFVFANIGQTGANILNDIIITDISSMRWRGFAIAVSFTPFLVTPWISGFIVEHVVSPDGIGWRWGIGMFAFIMPICATALLFPLFSFQHRAKKQGVILTQPISVLEFCSQVDLGGSFLLCAGFAMFLLPFTLAGSTPSRWQTPYIIALIVVGAITLIAMVLYEAMLAKHPILPARYFRNLSIVICCSLGFLDTLGFQCTHVYLYTFVTIAQNMSPRNATFLNYTNGVVQCLFGILGGAIMWKTRSYKWLMVIGTVIKLVGFGLMIRLRGSSNSWAELFIVQAVQGVGSGFIETIIIVGSQIVVPRVEQAQVTALVLLFVFLGASVGTSVAGGIYSGNFREALEQRLGSASPEVVTAVYESITSAQIPADGTAERDAASLAYSDVLRYITYVAVATSALCVVIALFLPDHRLRDGKTLVSGVQGTDVERIENGRR
ncbi:uncharacterized protein HMPREF1541_03120 [Cyphellophora europaea CBS 101466]|uniref:Major facilitator superfamily (MFS) profile domain-containing protein n=1 Tax=Cyphellophora europaea (strain CBS 101466) TaxID=1220924 RepID=W2RXY1_CYPE1|nr:uncharacterized protein HMPREF1541_03120 [Cyphellophora europaea CBS 101466]ETN41185.1 hypothetical protein HMPREF1541_03120 [Cyphellophora europaea CBS 101466]